MSLVPAILAVLIAAAAVGKIPGEVYDHIDRGNHFYTLGLFDEAGREYAAAAELARELPIVSYNLGNVYHQKMVEARHSAAMDGLSDEEWRNRAIAAYKNAAHSSSQTLAAHSLFNLGTTYALAGNIDDAILSLQETLRILPDDADTKHNLELLLEAKKNNPDGTTVVLTGKKPPEKSGTGTGIAEASQAGGEGEANSGMDQSSPDRDSSEQASSQQDSAHAVASSNNQQKKNKDQKAELKAAAKDVAQSGSDAKAADLSTLSPKNAQVLDKANKLEQRMVDGWDRPPDFKQPEEKDW